MSLVRLAPREYLYLITIHHLVTDWIAYQIFLSELLTIYAAYRAGRPSPLPPPALQFPDYALWSAPAGRARARPSPGRRASGSMSWKASRPPWTCRPTGRARPCRASAAGLSRERRGGADRAPARPRPGGGATTFMATLAVVATLLWRLTGLEKSSSARTRQPAAAGAAAVAGLFLNQIPFAVDLSGDPTFRQLVGRCRKTALAAYSHQFLPFSRLIEILAWRRIAAATRWSRPSSWF